MPELTHLLWIDLETTGVNENLDDIIEVGFILTNKDLEEKCSGSSIIQITERGWRRLEANEFVMNMHVENGLVEALRERGNDYPTGGEYEDELLEVLSNEGVESHQVMLAGSGVGHFDRRFIAEHMPTLDRVLAYPVIDVGVIRRFWEELCGRETSGINESKTHRALDDIKCHLEEARWFKRQFSA